MKLLKVNSTDSTIRTLSKGDKLVLLTILKSGALTVADCEYFANVLNDYKGDSDMVRFHWYEDETAVNEIAKRLDIDIEETDKIEMFCFKKSPK